MKKVLVIKHGALGDVAHCFGVFQALRHHHANQFLVLMTTLPYAGFLKSSGLFDDFWIDTRPKLWRFGKLWKLRQRFWQENFQCVYDLQNSQRTAFYFNLFRVKKKIPWSGTVKGCLYRQTRPDRNLLPTQERLQDQLKSAGIQTFPAPDMSWCRPSLDTLEVPESPIVLIPGSSAGGSSKRWPAEYYAALARALLDQDSPLRGCPIVVLGGDADKAVTDIVCESNPEIVNLTGKTSLTQIVAICRGARIIIGNDTGPIHLAAATGKPTYIIWSSYSNPKIYAPSVPNAQILHTNDLHKLTWRKVFEQLMNDQPF